MAISVDKPAEARKTESLVGKSVPLLSDPDLKITRAYGMESSMDMGTPLADMGYVIIGKDGRLMQRASDPLFGQNTGAIITHLKANG